MSKISNLKVDSSDSAPHSPGTILLPCGAGENCPGLYYDGPSSSTLENEVLSTYRGAVVKIEAPKCLQKMFILI